MYCYHTHTHFCDGTSASELYAKNALQLHFHSLGFSGHAPLPFTNNFALTPSKLTQYCNEIKSLQSKYQDKLNVLLGLEMDYIPEISIPFEELIKKCQLDYTIGSVHFVRNPVKERLWFIDGPKREIWDKGLEEVMEGDVKGGVTFYYQQIQEMIEQEKPDIVGHLDKIMMYNAHRYFSESESWYRYLVIETLEKVHQSGVILEINTRGLYKKNCEQLFPSETFLPIIKEMGIPVIISADAHDPSEIGLLFTQTLHLLLSKGFEKIYHKGFECYN
jgi:histidinol-phosphatase (PHP family)